VPLLKGNAIRLCSSSSFVFIIVFLQGGLGMCLPVITYDEIPGRKKQQENSGFSCFNHYSIKNQED